MAIRYVHIADPIGETRKPKPIIIHIEIALPYSGNMTLEQLGEVYEKDAQTIVDALFGSLPQATRLRVEKKLFEKEIANNGFFRGI